MSASIPIRIDLISLDMDLPSLQHKIEHVVHFELMFGATGKTDIFAESIDNFLFKFFNSEYLITIVNDVQNFMNM